MLSKLWVHTWDKYKLDFEENIDSYLNIGKINFFIGKNNSGKSRLVRSFFSCNENHISYILSNDNLAQFKLELSNIESYLNPDCEVNNIKGSEIKRLSSVNNIYSYDNRKTALSYTEEIKTVRARIHRQSGRFNGQHLQNFLNDFERKNGRNILEGQIQKHFNFNKIYIPILRGMRPVSEKNEAYKERTKNDYFKSGLEKNSIIHTGEELYDLLKEHLLGLPKQREQIKLYESLLSIYFFEGKNIALIPKHDEDVVNIKIGEDPQYPIHQLGDGLQQIIIITSGSYLEEKPSQIIIEEPETGIHPGLLRQLINFLIIETPHQYFITTHSNHLLDFSDERDDVLTHRVYRDPSKEAPFFKISNINRDRKILLDLGVKSSSLYLANCTIWVEGITDRLYITAMLSNFLNTMAKSDNGTFKTSKHYLVNYHYAFVEYQGGNLTHWSFDEEARSELQALSVTSHILLIADGDIKTKGKRAEELHKALGKNFILLKGKEIENLLPEIIVKESAKELFSNFRRETFKKNIDDIEKLKYKNYCKSNEGLGFHLDKCLGLKGKGDNRTNKIFADSSGTLKDKMKFCAIATRKMNEIEWESTKEISELCNKVYSHMKKL